MVDTTEFNLVPNNEEEEFTVDFGEVTRLAGSSDFNQLQNRPQYDGQVMTGETDIPKVPTATSELNNDSDYQTGSEVQQTINAAIANKQDKLTAGQNITISEQNVISATGLTEVDWGDIGGNLNDQIDLKDVLDAKQDTLAPGDNVTIANNIISATDTKYTAGNGLSLNGTQFSADTAVLQEKLDAGNAITIENNTINADIYPADFFTNEATATDTGSNITLDKTIPATLKSVELYGDTYQQTYSGKNLWKTAPDGSFTSSGITSTRSNGTITCTGTSTNVAAGTSDFYDLDTPLPAGTYTLSIKNALPYRVEFVIKDSNGDNHFSVIAAGSRTKTITTNYEAVKIRNGIGGYTAGTEINVTIEEIQLEAGSSATSYEPYVGGTASPNPDYPQDIHVVTGEQTVTVNGKNKINPNNLSYIYASNQSRTTLASLDTGIKVTISAGSEIQPFVLFKSIDLTNYVGSTIRMNGTFDALGGDIRIGRMDASGGNRTSTVLGTTSGEPISFTVPSDLGTSPYLFYGVRCASTSTQLVNNFTNLILTVDDDVIPFQPYQSQSYTVDLGTTELCKIGDYQDYIYKSGDDWYIHKEVGKQTIDGTSTWTVQNNTKTNYVYYQTTSPTFISTGVNDVAPALSTQLIAMSGSVANNSDTSSGFAFSTSGYLRVNLPRVDFPDVAAVKSHFTANPMDVYYALETPTDTKITDAGLIADLNALAGAKSYLDVTNFTVTATGTNLPALLKPEVYVNSLHSIIELLNSYK